MHNTDSRRSTIDPSILQEMDVRTLEKLASHYQQIYTKIRAEVAKKKSDEEQKKHAADALRLRKRAVLSVGFRIRDLDEPFDVAIIHTASTFNVSPDALAIWVKYSAKERAHDYQMARKAMILRMARSMTNQQIADYFGIHRNTVSLTISKAIRTPR